MATYELVELYTLTDTGTPIVEAQYIDIVHEPDLPDALFLPPDAMETKRPESPAEYMRLIGEMFRRDIENVSNASLQRARQMRSELQRQFDQEVRDARMSALRDQPPPRNSMRNSLHLGRLEQSDARGSVLLYATLMLVAALVGAIALKWSRHRKASERR